MKIERWLKDATLKLKESGIGTARLDCLILAEDATGKDRSWLLAHPEHQLTIKLIKGLGKKIEQRSNHIPLAYVRGKTEFFGREFFINYDVLEPRPESEAMIELLKQLILPTTPHIADVGSGSGAIGITAKLELPSSVVGLFDIDAKTLEVAQKNIKKHIVDINYYMSDLLEAHKEAYDVVMANLPYVPDKFTLNRAAEMEPKLAIFGGPDGLDLYRKLFSQVCSFSWRPKYVLTESMPPQHKSLAGIAKSKGFKLKKTQDFIQLYQLI